MLALARSYNHLLRVQKGNVGSYSIKALEGLFADSISPSIAFGNEGETYNRSLLWVRQRLAGRFAREERAVCYSCHATSSLVPRWPFLISVCDGLNARFLGAVFQAP